MEIQKRKKQKPKEIKTFAVDRTLYDEFKKEMHRLNLSISEVIGEFMRRVVDIIKSGGGEIVFGIEGTNWKKGDYEKKGRENIDIS